MAELTYSKFMTAVEDVIKYARVKRAWFRTRAWVSQPKLDALVAALPSISAIEKRLLGDAVQTIIASAVPKSARRSGEYPGFFVSYKGLKTLERAVRRDGLKWRIAFHTTGSIPGADYWGIDE